MEIRLAPLSALWKAGAFAVLLHVIGALVIDFLLWKSGWVYQVMGGQAALLAGWVWFLVVVSVVLIRLRRQYWLDPLRVFIWVLGVSVGSAPVKALGDLAKAHFLQAEYDAYPAKRAVNLRSYLRSREVPEAQIDSVITLQNTLFVAYRAREENWLLSMVDRLKVLGLLGLILGAIMGLLARGGAFGGGSGG